MFYSDTNGRYESHHDHETLCGSHWHTRCDTARVGGYDLIQFLEQNAFPSDL